MRRCDAAVWSVGMPPMLPKSVDGEWCHLGCDDVSYADFAAAVYVGTDNKLRLRDAQAGRAAAHSLAGDFAEASAVMDVSVEKRRESAARTGSRVVVKPVPWVPRRRENAQDWARLHLTMHRPWPLAYAGCSSPAVGDAAGADYLAELIAYLQGRPAHLSAAVCGKMLVDAERLQRMVIDQAYTEPSAPDLDDVYLGLTEDTGLREAWEMVSEQLHKSIKRSEGDTVEMDGSVLDFRSHSHLFTDEELGAITNWVGNMQHVDKDEGRFKAVPEEGVTSARLLCVCCPPLADVMLASVFSSGWLFERFAAGICGHRGWPF